MGWFEGCVKTFVYSYPLCLGCPRLLFANSFAMEWIYPAGKVAYSHLSIPLLKIYITHCIGFTTLWFPVPEGRRFNVLHWFWNSADPIRITGTWLCVFIVWGNMIGHSFKRGESEMYWQINIVKRNCFNFANANIFLICLHRVEMKTERIRLNIEDEHNPIWERMQEYFNYYISSINCFRIK